MNERYAPAWAMRRWRAVALQHQRGASLIVVLIMLSIIFVIGATSAQFAIFGERSARNDRDRQIAFQAAEAALVDAEIDIMGPNTSVSNRVCTFKAGSVIGFTDGACNTGTNVGRCMNQNAPGEAWKLVKANYASETGTGASNATVEYGQFTGRALPAGLVGSGGGLPVKPPRYTIEVVSYAGSDMSKYNEAIDASGTSGTTSGGGGAPNAYVVTAMGFGFRAETQVMLQAMILRPADVTTVPSCM